MIVTRLGGSGFGRFGWRFVREEGLHARVLVIELYAGSGEFGVLGIGDLGNGDELFGAEVIEDELGLVRSEAKAGEEFAYDVAGPHEGVPLFEAEELAEETVVAIVGGDVSGRRGRGAFTKTRFAGGDRFGGCRGGTLRAGEADADGGGLIDGLLEREFAMQFASVTVLKADIFDVEDAAENALDLGEWLVAVCAGEAEEEVVKLGFPV